jgi:ABC-type lipoprotein release transport system permease subunit
MPRLGIGALVTRDAFLRLHGDPRNDPEFTTIRLVNGADTAAVIDRLPNGFVDAVRSHTSWFTDAKPAEIRQLDVAMPYLRIALAFGCVILFAVVVHALWTRVRTNRRDLAVLRALGATRAQLDAVTAWQAAPFILATLVVGLPIGVALGRWAFTLFARSLAVVDEATVSAAMLGVLVAGVFVAFAIAAFVSVVVARRDRSAAVLRGD